MIHQAEQKKNAVRDTIEDMREEFKNLLEKNEALPPNIRLIKKVSKPMRDCNSANMPLPTCIFI